jgi:hypothetical protein
VKCSNGLVRASVYKDADEAIISVASWSEKELTAVLAIDWQKLGFAPSAVDVFIPGIKDFQEEQSKVSINKLTIPGKEGFLIVEKKKSYKQRNDSFESDSQNRSTFSIFFNAVRNFVCAGLPV